MQEKVQKYGKNLNLMLNYSKTVNFTQYLTRYLSKTGIFYPYIG